MPQYDQRNKYLLVVLKKSLYLIVNVLIAVVACYGVFSLCRFGYRFCYDIFGPVVLEAAPGSDRSFTVDEGDNMADVAKRLEDENIIANGRAFYIRTRFMDSEKTALKPGNYTLNTSMDYEDIINELTDGG